MVTRGDDDLGGLDKCVCVEVGREMGESGGSKNESFISASDSFPDGNGYSKRGELTSNVRGVPTIGEGECNGTGQDIIVNDPDSTDIF